MHNTSRSQDGFSIVAVLVISAVILSSILLVSQAKFRQQGTQKALKMKQSYTDINQALINAVVETFHAKMENSCLVGGWNDLKNKDLDGRTKFSQNTEVGVDMASQFVPQTHKEAATRCKTPKSPGSPSNRFYFCVKIEKDPTAPIDSILGANVAFAEFAVELIDLQTQTAIPCSEYTKRKKDRRPDGTARDGSAGMAVTMALYWQNGTPGPPNAKSTFSQKALSYIANQN